MNNQQVQMKVLRRIEEQEREIAEVAKEERRMERLSRNEKLRKYWDGKREEAKLEAPRGQMSILNLSNEWLDVEMHYHEEMDTMMNVTGAVVAMEESTLSLNREEMLLDELMESVRPEMMDTASNACSMKEVVDDMEDWWEDTIFKEIDFDDWVEVEMETLNVTMEVGPEEVLVSRQESIALGLAIFNPESYATPKKTYIKFET